MGASRKEAVEANDKWGKKVAKHFGKLSTKVKITLLVVIVVALVGFFRVVLPWITDNHETQYLTTSDLKSAVDIDSLSTVDYTYHGIVEKHGRFLWMDRVDYRVKYEAHIRASYTMSDIQFDIDEENKVVTAYLPKARVGEPQLDNSKFKTLVCWPRSGQLQPTRYAGGDKRLYKATPPTDIDDCSGRQEFESKGWSPWPRRPTAFPTRSGCASTTSCSRRSIGAK